MATATRDVPVPQRPSMPPQLLSDFRAELPHRHNRGREGVKRIIPPSSADTGKILFDLQTAISKAETLLDINLHVLAEGKHIFIVPLYSQSLLFAVANDYHSSAFAIASLSQLVRHGHSGRSLFLYRIQKMTNQATS